MAHRNSRLLPEYSTSHPSRNAELLFGHGPFCSWNRFVASLYNSQSCTTPKLAVYVYRNTTRPSDPTSFRKPRTSPLFISPRQQKRFGDLDNVQTDPKSTHNFVLVRYGCTFYLHHYLPLSAILMNAAHSKSLVCLIVTGVAVNSFVVVARRIRSACRTLASGSKKRRASASSLRQFSFSSFHEVPSDFGAISARQIIDSGAGSSLVSFA